MKQIRCALYPRVSTEEQFVNGLSLPAQVKDLTDYANRMNYHIVDIYADEGVSARKPVSKRPALLRLLKDVEAGKIDLILVTKLDRWFRNIKEYQITQEILEKNHCYWKTIFEDYDTSTANGQMIVNIMLAVNQSECDRTSERIKVVLEHKVRNGEHVTGAAPYGYISVNKKLEKDPETEQIVNDIFNSYFSNFSKRKTVFYIEDKYADHPKKPTKYQINRILSKELYAGIYRDMEDFFPAYITKEQFHTIQATCDTKTHPHRHEDYIFSGLILCPVCNTKLTGFITKHKKTDGTYSEYKRYKCYKKFNTHSSPCLTESVVETYMLEHLCSELDTVMCSLEKRNTRKTNKIPAIRSEMDRLNILYQKGRITDEYYDRQYEILEASLLQEQAYDPENKLEKFEKLQKKFSGNWKELYDLMDASHKNAFWKNTIESIYVDEKTHKVSGFSFL